METVVATKVLKGPRACATCAKAKSRCIAGPRGQDKCERCHRLQKPCSSQTPAPARKRKEPKPTRVAELERRLEDLTARIESVQRLGPAAPSPPDSDNYVPPSAALGGTPADSEDPLPPRNLSGTQVPIPTFGRDRWDSPFGHLFPDRSIFETQPEHEQPTASGNARSSTQDTSPPVGPMTSVSTQPTASTSLNSSPYQRQQPPTHPPQHQPSSNLWPHGDEAEAFVGVYRENMAHLFPFAVVPPDMSAAQLRERRPFLWKAIMMEACLFEGARQVALGNALLREISEAAFVRPQKDLDLLQGLQMLIAWYHYNLNNFQMVNLLFLARSITLSLESAEVKSLPGEGGYSSESLEQMRAFAGTYYLVTITFTTNKRPDGLMNNMNTSYLATCCRALHSQMEYPTDELVVHLIRTQQLSQSVSQAFARRKAVSGENQSSPRAFIQGLRERIQAFAATLPPHIRTNPSLAGHLQVAEILAYDNSLGELSHCPFGKRTCERTSIAGIPSPVDQPNPERIEMLWECARLVLTFMSNRFAEEIGDYPRFVCASSFDLTYVFLTMLKLVTLRIPGWDSALAAKELRFDDFMCRLMHRMEYTAERRKRKSKESLASGGSDGHNAPTQINASSLGDVAMGGQEEDFEDTYTKLARKLRNVRDSLNFNGFGDNYTTSELARVCDTAPMTLADATQDLMQDLGGGMWQDAATGASEWDAFFSGETVDWAAILNNYNIESGYMT